MTEIVSIYKNDSEVVAKEDSAPKLKFKKIGRIQKD